MAGRRKTLVALTALSAAALAGLVLASNMGFTQPYPLLGASNPESKSGTNLIALPYYPEVDTQTALKLFIDTSATAIFRHTRATDQFQVYTFGGVNFALPAGEALIVYMPVGTNNYTMIGSHDPGLQVQLLSASSPLSKSGTNFYAHPYHGVSATASELFREIGSATGVQRLMRATDTFQVYSYGAADFPLTPGEGLIVTVSSDVTFVPNHY